jgi:hypothetical protein
MVIAYKSSSLSFAILLSFVLIGCNDGSVLHSETEEPARGTAIIALNISQGLCVDIGRVEIIATDPDLDEHFPDVLLDSGLRTGMIDLPVGKNRALTVNAYDTADELLYTGSGQTDVLFEQQVRLEVMLQPVREVVKLLPLAFMGAGDFASERFLLKA